MTNTSEVVIGGDFIRNRFTDAVDAVRKMVSDGYTYAEAVSINAEHFGVDYRKLMEYFRE